MPVGKNSIKRATGNTTAKATFAVGEMAKAPAVVGKPVAKTTVSKAKAPVNAKKTTETKTTATKKPAQKKTAAPKVEKPVVDNIHEKKFEAARAMFCALPDYLL